MTRPVLVGAAILLGVVGTGLAHACVTTADDRAAVALVVDTPAVGSSAPGGEAAPSAAAAPRGGAAADPAARAPAGSSAPSGPPRASDTWVVRTAATTGIPARAVRAYGATTLTLAAEDPACHLGWTTLAGIGAVESGHGTHGGAQLQDDGRPSVPVIGPALDGADGVASVRATAASRALDGDPAWQHAVGPLQFLPDTWARWAADGDGDGVADPQDVDDAALAAGRYLCAAGGDLSTPAGWRAAVLAYNHADSYVAQVLDTADRYARAAR